MDTQHNSPPLSPPPAYSVLDTGSKLRHRAKDFEANLKTGELLVERQRSKSSAAHSRWETYYLAAAIIHDIACILVNCARYARYGPTEIDRVLGKFSLRPLPLVLKYLVCYYVFRKLPMEITISDSVFFSRIVLELYRWSEGY